MIIVANLILFLIYLVFNRRDSVSRSDTSGSSAGDLGEMTPCNASPHMTGMISYRVPIRDEAEEQWRRNIESFLYNPATNYAPDLLMQMYRVVKVCFTAKRKKDVKYFYVTIDFFFCRK